MTRMSMPPPSSRLDRRLLRVACAHVVVDCYSNVFAPLLPLLIPKLGLRLATVGVLTMVFQIAASVSQLGFGRLADRWHPHRLLVAGPIVAVTLLSLIGIAPNTAWLAAILIAGGLGAAAFHPPSAMLAHRFSGSRPGLGMSLFVGGGTAGFALAPLVFPAAAERYGLAATPWLMLPGLAALAIVLRGLPETAVSAHAARGGFGVLRPYAKPLTLLYLIVVLRTVAALSFVTFVPIYLTERGLSVAQAGAVVAIYLLASSAGGFVGGPLADRFGPRHVITGSLLLAAPFLLAAPSCSGLTFTIVLAIGGFFLQSTQPVSVAFGQTIAPVAAGTVSSLMMGVGWGSGGVLIPFIGLLAERIGIDHALRAMALVPLVAAALAWPLPELRRDPAAGRSEEAVLRGPA
jgi:FSR family fosmidomycin resistance protein-like MFS transporter